MENDPKLIKLNYYRCLKQLEVEAKVQAMWSYNCKVCRMSRDSVVKIGKALCEIDRVWYKTQKEPIVPELNG